ncbi:MAG: DUF1203 domain-containing protein [Pseudomonadota bacterium]
MFQIHGLEAEPFQHLFQLSDEALKAQNACRRVVDESPGTPCRVSLEDARLGEEVILVNFEHLPVSSPYQSRHAIYVRRNVEQATLDRNEVPQLLRHRLIAVRAFDSDDMMAHAETVAGTDLEPVMQRFLADEAVQYLHLHYANAGCFAARVTRD